MTSNAWSSFQSSLITGGAINVVTLALVIADILPSWAFLISLLAGLAAALCVLFYRASTNGYRNKNGDDYAPHETTPRNNT